VTINNSLLNAGKRYVKSGDKCDEYKESTVQKAQIWLTLENGFRRGGQKVLLAPKKGAWGTDQAK